MIMMMTTTLSLSLCRLINVAKSIKTPSMTLFVSPEMKHLSPTEVRRGQSRSEGLLDALVIVVVMWWRRLAAPSLPTAVAFSLLMCLLAACGCIRLYPRAACRFSSGCSACSSTRRWRT